MRLLAGLLVWEGRWRCVLLARDSTEWSAVGRIHLLLLTLRCLLLLLSLCLLLRLYLLLLCLLLLRHLLRLLLLLLRGLLSLLLDHDLLLLLAGQGVVLLIALILRVRLGHSGLLRQWLGCASLLLLSGDVLL